MEGRLDIRNNPTTRSLLSLTFFFTPLFSSVSIPPLESLAYPLDLALAKFRLATGEEDARGAAAISTGSALSRARACAHTLPHGERSRTGTRGKRRKRDEPLDDDSCQ